MSTPTPPDNPPRNPPGSAGPGDASDYLWDRTGAPDPFVERLETLLAPSALREQDGPSIEPQLGQRPGPFRIARRLAIAAALLLAVVIGTRSFWSPAPPGWNIASTSGAPTMDGRRVKPHTVLNVGKWLETDATSTASVRVANIGTLDVEPDSRLRIHTTRDTRHEVELAHGVIHATITAPPRLFFVQTRAALATDMGCKYDLAMPETGPGLLTVRFGWVLLEGNRTSQNGAPLEVRVPRGVSCVIDDLHGPGTPFRDGATLVRDLLRPLDHRAWMDVTDSELDALLSACGSGDAVTIWHILFRLNDAQRATAYQRLRVLFTMPVSITDDKVLSLDPETMEHLWGRVAWDVAGQGPG